MPRSPKGARIYLQPERRNEEGAVIDRATWVIRDGPAKRRTGLGPGDRQKAEVILAAYIAEKYRPDRSRNRHATTIPVSDVLNIFLTDVAPRHARPGETAARVAALVSYFGDKMLSAVNGATCRAYVTHRGARPAARRELEDLRAAINHHRKEGLCRDLIEVTLPRRSTARQRWLSRSEVASLLWAAWQYRETQQGSQTARRSRQHVARFILLALYTGTRSAAVCAASFSPDQRSGWIDLERGIFYRKSAEAKETKKRQPPVPLPNRLLAHLRRWQRLGQSAPVEWNGQRVVSVKKAFAQCVAATGLGCDVTPHVLRHTAATWLMQSGTDLWEAAGYLGMTVETLQGTYGHHHPDWLGNARAAFDNPGQKSDRISRTKRVPSDDNRTKIIALARRK